MTGDPERLLSGSSGASEIERALLESVRDVGPKDDHKKAIWGALATQIATVSVVGGAQASTSAGLKSGLAGLLPKSLAGKLMLGLALGGSAVGAGALYLGSESEPPARIPVAPRQAVEASEALQKPTAPEPAPEAPACAGEKCGEPSAASPPAVARRAPEPSKKDRLAEESALITEARAALRRGDARAAEAALERLHHEFPKGVLGQEREVLSIETLAARGDTEGARRRARAFVTAHPKSPHSQKLGRFLEQP